MGMLLRRHRKVKQHAETKQGNKKGHASKTEQEKKTANYESLTVPELKEIAKEKDIKGYNNMKKADLIETLKG